MSRASAERNLEDLTQKAEGLARRLELLMASLHDLPDPKAAQPEPAAEEEGRRLRFVRRRGGADLQEECE